MSCSRPNNSGGVLGLSLPLKYEFLTESVCIDVCVTKSHAYRHHLCLPEDLCILALRTCDRPKGQTFTARRGAEPDGAEALRPSVASLHFIGFYMAANCRQSSHRRADAACRDSVSTWCIAHLA